MQPLPARAGGSITPPPPQHFRAKALGERRGMGEPGGRWLAAAALPAPCHLPISWQPRGQVPARQGRGCYWGTEGSPQHRGSPSLGELSGVPTGRTGLGSRWGQHPTLQGQMPWGWALWANPSALVAALGRGRGPPTGCARTRPPAVPRDTGVHMFVRTCVPRHVCWPCTQAPVCQPGIARHMPRRLPTGDVLAPRRSA